MRPTGEMGNSLRLEVSTDLFPFSLPSPCMQSSLVLICCPGFSQPHGRVCFPAIRSHSANVRRRRRTLGQWQFTPLQQSRVSPWHPGAGQREDAALFKEQVIDFPCFSCRLCGLGNTNLSRARAEQSSELHFCGSSTNPSQPARSLCQSHKDTEPQRPAAVKSSFSFDTRPSLRRIPAGISPLPPQRERRWRGRGGAALQGAEPARSPAPAPGTSLVPTLLNCTAHPRDSPGACPAPGEKAVLKWQAEHGKSNPHSYPPL